MCVFLRGQLTVFYEEPFWVGVFERSCDGQLEVCKVTFGAEPKGPELYAFIHKHYDRLHFSAPIADDLDDVHKRLNPKRMQRQIRKAADEKGVRTKAQAAIQLQLEAGKLERKKNPKRRKNWKIKLRSKKSSKRRNRKSVAISLNH